MRGFPAWVGGVVGFMVTGGAVLARSPDRPAPVASAVVPQAWEEPARGTGQGHVLFAPACSAVYRADGCTQPRHIWKA